MTISYNWLSKYLPEKIEPEKLSRILTSIGLEVEAMEHYQSIKGGLKDVVIAEVLTCEKHPNADKLKVTTVNIGEEEPLKVVCGAPNVAAGQKVVLAKVGATLYPSEGEPMTMKVAKIRGEESYGMICAEDELGMGQSHAGIMVLPDDVKPGTPASEYFSVYEDVIYEIGLTPNRMDAMSHYGVARDVCAYLVRHENKKQKAISPFANVGFKTDNNNLPVKVTVENTEACPRYAGVTISNIKVASSPDWLKNALKSIGVRPINNVVDITNFILHETGQPLHAFDADKINGAHVIVKNLPEGSVFKTLDEKERKLTASDLMICDESGGMCIAGVFGGIDSGVTENTTNIFLESANFNAVDIRKTSYHHGLRTDAALRFEKGVDISNTVNVLKRAAMLIKEIAEGEISSDVVDVYPNPKEKNYVALKYHYLKKLSGKNYHHDTIVDVLEALGFEKIKESADEIIFAVPYSKPDISLPADIVEEILRIDGLDNIDIPSSVTITPAVDAYTLKEDTKEKLADYLVGLGFHEIVTNSITNSKYYSEEELSTAVHMLNNLSADLDIMRPSMLETGLEVIAYNLNRKNNNLQLFEYGKTYRKKAEAEYLEEEKLTLYLTGKTHEDEWNEKGTPQSFYRVKGIVQALITLLGFGNIKFSLLENQDGLSVSAEKKQLGKLIVVPKKKLTQFDIKAEVFYAEINIAAILDLKNRQNIFYKEVSKFPAVQRDLALVVDKSVNYESINAVIKKSNLNLLKDVRLFDVFESDKLGKDKKSMALNFTFLDEQKTLTDKEIDAMVNKLINGFEKELQAEIRK